MESFFIGLFSFAYAAFIGCGIRVLTVVDGWSFRRPVHLLLGHARMISWNATFHCIIGSILIPLINVVILLTYVTVFSDVRVHMGVWIVQLLSIAYPLTNLLMLYVWRLTGYQIADDATENFQ